MPSALRSGGGSLLSSVPGGAGGDPLSATYSDLPSGLTWMPRGRLPSGGGRDDRLRGGVDHREVAGGFVGDEDANRRDGRRGAAAPCVVAGASGLRGSLAAAGGQCRGRGGGERECKKGREGMAR